MKLAVKLAVCLVLGGVLVFAGMGWWLQRSYRTNSEELLLASAERITDVIRSSTRYEMLKNDREAMYHMIRDFGAEPGIRRVRIFSKEGEIRFSTDASEVGRVVNKNAEACFGCHLQAAPLEKLNRLDHGRVFREADGGRILATMLPIENQHDCSSAACHAHPPDVKVLGVIDAQLSLKQVDGRLAEQQTFLMRFTPVALAGLTLLSMMFVWGVVYRPVRELIAGTRRVAAGELDYRLPVRSKDELGELAAEFNHMTTDLKAARTEVETWTNTLEERVDRKTHELEQAHRSLLHSEKLASIGKLAATVAHEVNNPLFGILTNARLAQRQVAASDLSGETRTKLSGNLSVIERESRRCGEIVKNLLMFSRQAPQNIQPVDLNIAMRRALDVIWHQLILKNIELQLKLAELPVTVMGDAGQLQQVFLAILVNATDAMPQGGNLAICVERDDQNATVTIRDNGIGIAPDVLPRIFEPFFSTKEDQQRTGLGLAVAFGIVEQHKGTLQVTSKEREGTAFLIRLPLSGEGVPA